MKDFRKKAILLTGLFLFLFLFTGCGAALHTVLQLSPSFSGVRTMTMEINSDDFEKIEGGSVAVDRMIRENCPAEIAAAEPVLNNEGNSEYAFTLAFTDQADYCKKIEKILGREPVVQFSNPETVLASGFRVSEDFTSDDLMGWLREAIGREGLATGSTLNSLWSMEKTTLRYNGQEYPTGHKISVDQIEAYTVSKISLSTVIDETISREIRIDFPAATVRTLGNALTDYFAARIPSGAQASWENQGEALSLLVRLKASSAQDLEALSRQLFSNEQQTVTYGRDQEASTPLRDQRTFLETLELSGFSSGKNGVNLDYRFENKTGGELIGGFRYLDGEWKETGKTDGNVFTFSGTTSLLNIKLLTARQYYITGGEIYTERIDKDRFERRVTLSYDAGTQSGGAAYAKTYYEAAAGTDSDGLRAAVEQSGGQEKSVLTLTGSDSEVSAHLGEIFGTGTFFTYRRSTGALDFRSRSTYTDRIDLRDILEGDSQNAPLRYVLDLGRGESLEELHCLVKDEKGNTQSQQDFFPDPETGTASFTLPDGRVEISAAGGAFNWMGFLIIGGIVLCILLILLVMIIIIVKSDRPGGGPDDKGLLRIAEDEKKRLALKEAEENALAKLYR